MSALVLSELPSFSWEICEASILALARVSGLFASLTNSALKFVFDVSCAYSFLGRPFLLFSSCLFSFIFGIESVIRLAWLCLSEPGSRLLICWMDWTLKMSLILFVQDFCWVLNFKTHSLDSSLLFGYFPGTHRFPLYIAVFWWISVLWICVLRRLRTIIRPDLFRCCRLITCVFLCGRNWGFIRVTTSSCSCSWWRIDAWLNNWGICWSCSSVHSSSWTSSVLIWVTFDI